MQKRILVLGANGFIGRRLVNALQSADWGVPIAGVRAMPRSPAPGIEYRVLDAAREPQVAEALAGVDAAVNCVAGNADTIVAGAHALFTAASRAPGKPRVVHLSTMSVYGAAEGPVDESAALRADLGPYSAAKVAAEQAAAAHANTAILRPGLVYGPGSAQWSGRIAELLLARRLGDLGANGDGFCNLVHVDDVVAAIVRCVQLAEPAGAAFNLSTPAPPTWNEYLVQFARSLKAVPLRRISARRLKLEAKLFAPPLKIMELAAHRLKLPWSVPAVIPPSLLSLMRQEIKLDVRRAETVLGLVWTPLKVGIDAAARWYLHERDAG
jgi:nucleoside-diphosphate-sugar epimerase